MRIKRFFFVFLLLFNFLRLSCVINNYVVDDKPAKKEKTKTPEQIIEKNPNNCSLKLFNFYVTDEKNEKHNILLKITIACSEKQKILKKIIKENQKKIEKKVYDLLIKKKYRDFKLDNNIEKLKSEIIIKINKQLKKNKISRIYFSKLVIM